MTNKMVEFIIDGQIRHGVNVAEGLGIYCAEYDGSSVEFAKQYSKAKLVRVKELTELMEETWSVKIDPKDVRTNYMLLVRYWEKDI